jgi:drug/metabolite transporter (DMT)-like permease
MAMRARQPTLDVAMARAPYQQVTRALLLYFSMIAFALGVRELKLADTHAILAVMPLIVTALSAPMLGERVGWRRWLAVMTGFAGVLIILRPGIGVFHPAAIYPIACAIMLALYTVLTRRVSRHDTFLTTFFYTGVVGAAAATSIGFFYWSEPSLADWAFIGALCITSILGHFLLIRALELAPAAVLQSFHYLILVWAIILGFVFFNELPDVVTVAGGAVVVASGLFVVWREHAAARRTART